MNDLGTIALGVLVTWMPFLVVVPCLAVWVFLLRGELQNDEEITSTEARYDLRMIDMQHSNPPDHS